MFKSEAKLFLSANNNINSAKTLINECKRLIVDFDLEGNSDCKKLKSNINNCNINALVTKVEDTKESLMKLDQGFASEYMTLLQEFLQTSTIDTSNMTDEEKMQYSIQMDAYARDYNQNLLYILEKYEESGMLTDEMKQQLQYQRELAAQYDIQDKMAVLDPTTDEYIKLFKQCADYDRKLINLNPSLSEKEKASYLKEYNTQYNKNLDALINARDARLKREKDEKELEELYASKEDNNGFWHPFVESEIDEAILDKKIAMGIATEDEISYKNMNGWDRFWTDTGTFAASTFTGLFNITEGIGDGFVMLGSAVNIVDKEWASDYISRDISGELYQGIQLSNNMNSYSAYGTWHTVGEAFGGFVGKAGITFAAPWASAALYGLDAMGQSAETSFNNGDDYWAAFGKSVVSGIGGAAEGYGLAKLNLGIRNFASSGALKTLGGTAWSGIKTTLTSPGGLKVVGGNLGNLAKSGVKHIPSALGKAGLATLKDVDALIETGCVIANNFIEGVTTGEMDWGKLFKEAGAVFAINYFMSFVTTLAFDINTKKLNIDGVTDPNLYDGQPTDKLFDSEPTDKLLDGEPTDKIFDSDATEKIFDNDSTMPIFGTDDAVTTTTKIDKSVYGEQYPSYDAYHLDNLDESTNWKKSLSLEEHTISRAYTGESRVSSYHTMNAQGRGTLIDWDKRTVNLAGGEVYSFSDYENILKANGYNETITEFALRTQNECEILDTAISRSPLKKDTRLYRGVNRNVFSQFGLSENATIDELRQHLIGAEYKDGGFMSSTPDPNGGFLKGRDVHFIMDCAEGTPAIDVAQISQFANEKEVLLGMAQPFTITDIVEVEIDGRKKIQIYMETK